MNILLYVRPNEKGTGRFQCIINSIAGAVNISFTKRNPTYSYFIYVYSRNYNRETPLLSIGNRLFQSLGRINKIHGYHPGTKGRNVAYLMKPYCSLPAENRPVLSSANKKGTVWIQFQIAPIIRLIYSFRYLLFSSFISPSGHSYMTAPHFGQIYTFVAFDDCFDFLSYIWILQVLHSIVVPPSIIIP